MDRLTGPQSRALQSVGSGDSPEVVVEVLFRRHYPSLLRIASALLGTP